MLSQVVPIDVAATGTGGRSCLPSHQVDCRERGPAFSTVGSAMDKASFSALLERKESQREPGYRPVMW